MAIGFLLRLLVGLLIVSDRAQGFSSPTRSFESNALVLPKPQQQSSSTAPHLVFPGGGIFFYWQAGVVSFLKEQGYDLTQCTLTGASAGALTATLTSTGVDFYQATELALDLGAKARVWDRAWGLQGIWGPMIEEWLDALIPEESIENLDGRLSLLVAPLPTFGKTSISNFQSKSDLIKCNMASVHLPWFLDGRLTSNFRGGVYIDGSFRSSVGDYLLPDHNQNEEKALILDWKDDPGMAEKGGLDFVETLSPDGIWGLIEQGKTCARGLESEGKFEDLGKASS